MLKLVVKNIDLNLSLENYKYYLIDGDISNYVENFEKQILNLFNFDNYIFMYFLMFQWSKYQTIPLL